MREYSIRQIQLFNSSKIVFLDGYEILLDDCVKEWNLIYNCLSKCVAQRNVLANKPYFVFFAKERTKVVFDIGFLKSTRKKMFHDFQKTVIRYGYSTYDLS